MVKTLDRKRYVHRYGSRLKRCTGRISKVCGLVSNLRNLILPLAMYYCILSHFYSQCCSLELVFIIVRHAYCLRSPLPPKTTCSYDWVWLDKANSFETVITLLIGLAELHMFNLVHIPLQDWARVFDTANISLIQNYIGFKVILVASITIESPGYTCSCPSRVRKTVWDFNFIQLTAVYGH